MDESKVYHFRSEDIAAGPRGCAGPLSVEFSPDGKTLTYLFPDAKGVRQIFAVDVNTNEKSNSEPYNFLEEVKKRSGSEGANESSTLETLSLQEQLRRERMRLFTNGVSSYEWSKYKPVGGEEEFQRLIVPLNGNVFMYDESVGSDSPFSYSAIYSREFGAAVDPHLSPDGSKVAFVIDDDLYVLHIIRQGSTPTTEPSAPLRTVGSVGQVAGGKLVRLTVDGAKPGISCGLADFVAQEEMDRYRGFWWAPDSGSIVYAEVDETVVPEYQILHQGKSDPKHSETHRYPFSGEANPIVKLAVVTVPAASSKLLSTEEIAVTENAVPPVVWLDVLGGDPQLLHAETAPASAAEESEPVFDYYIARVGWWPNGSVMVQVQNRAQTLLQLLMVDPSSGMRQVLLEERSDFWINLHDMLHCFQPLEINNRNSNGNRNNHHSMITQDTFFFLWASERSGFRQLYLYRCDIASSPSNAVAVPLNTLPTGSGPGRETGVGAGSPAVQQVPIGGGGDFVVESIAGVDVARNCVYYSSNHGDDRESHCFAAPLSLSPLSSISSSSSGSAVQTVSQLRDLVIKLTAEPGMHSVVVSAADSLMVDTYSSVTVPVRSVLLQLPEIDFTRVLVNRATSLVPAPKRTRLSAEGGEKEGMVLCVVIADNADSATLQDEAFLSALALPEFKTIRSADDKVNLHCAIYKPSAASGARAPYPCVVSVYGGPHVQYVSNRWYTRVDLRAQRLAQQGILVLKCDGRGSYRRGIQFEGALLRDMGNIEVQDQSHAVSVLASEGLIDQKRVGIFGWSYGGYMSAMSLCRAPDTFHCACAGAPVTSWDGYDTHYTERYMGTPVNNPTGYADSAVMSHVSKMTGKLLLVHGLIDENVHFRHTARLINKLIEQRKRYQLVLFPCERHSPHKPQDRVYMEDIIFEFFRENLSASQPVAAAASKSLPPQPPHSSSSSSSGGAVKISAHL